MQTRKCCKCTIIKPITDFGKHRIKNGIQEYHYKCRDCKLVDSRAKYAAKTLAEGRKQYNYVENGCKTCKTCGVSKPVTEFYSIGGKTENRSCYHAPSCKLCSSVNHKIKTKSKRQTFHGVMVDCVNRFKRTTKRRQAKHPEYNMCNPDPSITADYLVETFGDLPEVIAMQANYIKTGDVNDKPTVDRIDPKKGYTKDNIQILTWRDNKKRNGEDWGRRTGPLTGPVNVKFAHEKSKKPVLKICPVTLAVLEEFDSGKAAAEAMGCHKATVSAAVKKHEKTGKYSLTQNFYWRFKG